MKKNLNKKYNSYSCEEYEEKCLEIFNYFDGLSVMNKLLNEENIKIKVNLIKKDPFLYNITLSNQKDFLVIHNHEITNLINPIFNCIFLFEMGWDWDKNIMLGDELFQPKFNSMKILEKIYRQYYMKKLDFNFLDFKDINIISSMNTMSDSVRIRCNIIDVDLEKILSLKEFIGELNET